MIIAIYDTGKVYQLEIDPNDLPEWVQRWLGLDNYMEANNGRTGKK